MEAGRIEAIGVVEGSRARAVLDGVYSRWLAIGGGKCRWHRGGARGRQRENDSRGARNRISLIVACLFTHWRSLGRRIRQRPCRGLGSGSVAGTARGFHRAHKRLGWPRVESGASRGVPSGRKTDRLGRRRPNCSCMGFCYAHGRSVTGRAWRLDYRTGVFSFGRRAGKRGRGRRDAHLECGKCPGGNGAFWPCARSANAGIFTRWQAVGLGRTRHHRTHLGCRHWAAVSPVRGWRGECSASRVGGGAGGSGSMWRPTDAFVGSGQRHLLGPVSTEWSRNPQYPACDRRQQARHGVGRRWAG